MTNSMALAVYKTFNEKECWVCGVLFAITPNLEAAKKRDRATLYCPNGCKLGFGESDADILRKKLAEAERQRDFEAQRAATNYAAREKAERKLRSIEKRVSGGVCPHCDRTFVSLGRHMKTKHPECVTGAGKEK